MEGQTEYLRTQLENISIPQLNLLMLDKAIFLLGKVVKAIEENNIADRHRYNKRVIEIINFLAIDLENYGLPELTKPLFELYKGVLFMLAKIDLYNDKHAAERVVALLTPQREAWRAQHAREKAMPQPQQESANASAPAQQARLSLTL